jgi:adenylate cyclase
MARRGAKFLETKYFGLVIGVMVFALLWVLATQTALISYLEQLVLDINFGLKYAGEGRRVQEGVTLERRNPRISPDILIVGIDDKSLDAFGRWPFPRYTEANLINAFTKIRDENERERALFLDITFDTPSVAEYDAMLAQSIGENGRAFLETILTPVPAPAGTDEELRSRQQVLYERYGTVTDIEGDWTRLMSFHGIFPPLKPFGRAARGYGHPNFSADQDGVYRRQPLLIKSPELLQEIPLDELSPQDLTAEERRSFVRLSWIDRDNRYHDVPYPLTQEVIAELRNTMQREAPQKAVDLDNDGNPDLYYHVVRKYRDEIIPAITLSLALEYFHKSFSDLEIMLGKYIRIPSPEAYNPETQAWEPYRLLVKPPQVDAEGAVIKPAVTKQLDEIRIPIDERAQMLVNFMGDRSSASPEGRQTFPVRSFSGYASRIPNPDPARWPRTMAVGNRIIMVGAFASGMAEDEKTTPFGLMFGVEIHANALNTILMNNFLYYLPPWGDALILLGLALLTAFMASRLPTVWSLVLSLVLIAVFAVAVTLLFDMSNFIIPFAAPAFAVLLS